MMNLKMVDLQKQYLRIKQEIDTAVLHVLHSSSFIQGPEVQDFEYNLSQFVGSKYVVTCGNGTDALSAALMALEIGKGDEVITVPFTFIATVEAIVLTGAKPVFVDVNPDSFTMDAKSLEAAVTPNTKAIIPVHLFGQCADMEPIMEVAKKYRLRVIEDACQAVGAACHFSEGAVRQAGTIGDMGCFSFFPSKNLGAYGDGGAIVTDDESLAVKLRSLCRHGSQKRYHHQLVGFNSRLDTLQAAVLNVKLKHLEEFNSARENAADYYYACLSGLDWLVLPAKSAHSTHTYHQFTVKVTHGKRDILKQYLADHEIPTAVYYPIPAHLQPAYRFLNYRDGDFPVSEQLCREVLSLPMHTELDEAQLQYICQTIVNCQL